MPCDSLYNAQRRAEARARAEKELMEQRSRLEFDEMEQAIKIKGSWEDFTTEEKAGYCDGCMINALKSENSMAVQEELIRLQAETGKAFLS